MKLCRFCLESIHDLAEACGHCGQWQPSLKEISYRYREVALSMARSKMGAWAFKIPFILSLLFGVFFILPVAIIVFSEAPIVSIFVLPFAFLPFGWRNKLLQRSLYKTVFDNAIELDKLLQEKLKEAATPKPQSFTKALVVMGVLIIMTISNPSRQDFDHFQLNQNGVDALGISKVTRINLVVCSMYVYTLSSQDKIYFSWGVLGNFFSFNIKKS